MALLKVEGEEEGDEFEDEEEGIGNEGEDPVMMERRLDVNLLLIVLVGIGI